LPDEIAIALFDMAFHSGVEPAAETLQKALLVKIDGQIGPKTVTAARGAGSVGVLYFLKARGAFMVEIWKKDRTQLVGFGKGWLNRLLDQAWGLR
jgi:lysozyme family protein